MSGGHRCADPLHADVVTPGHQVDAAVKIACLVGFLFAVVVTPPAQVLAFAVYAALVAGAVVVVRLPAPVLARRLLIELPFVVFAVALPFIGTGPHREVLGISMSIPGLWAAWAILAKATLGTAATVVLAWCTPVPAILDGLDRLRMPRILTAIAGFMVRYLDIVSDELRRLQIARVSRGDDPRWFWQGRAVAATAGNLFVRSFERGDRVHQAMLARGFTGRFPDLAAERQPLRWLPTIAWPCAAWAVAVTAMLR